MQGVAVYKGLQIAQEFDQLVLIGAAMDWTRANVFEISATAIWVKFRLIEKSSFMQFEEFKAYFAGVKGVNYR
jgi:hypothetical protein